MPRYPVLSFNAGEISPMVDARSDVDKYSAGCRTLENMIPRIYGPAERRPGTKYIDTCQGESRVMPFIYSNTISYILLLEDLRMYFYYGGGRVLDTWGRRLKVDTPYLAGDLPLIQYKQSNDVMWLVHPDYAPRKLTRTSANAFSLDEITFTDGPFKKRNDLANEDGVTMTPSVTTGSGTLTASSSFFAAGHVGALFSVTQPRVNTEMTGWCDLWGGQSPIPTFPYTIGSPILVEGSFTLTTHGTWTGTIVLERSIDYLTLGGGATWETFRKWTGETDTNVQYTGIEEEANVYYRIRVLELTVNIQPGTTSLNSAVRAELTVNSSTQTGICRITGYTSPTLASMTVLKAFASTNADKRWQEGCWSTYRGYPRAVAFFENRCVYAGTAHQPQTVWFSATDDFENFDECTKDDSAFSLTMSSDTRNAIQWISALEALIVGTTGGHWRIRSTSLDEPLTPSNFSFKRQTTYGSKSIQALPVNDAILSVDLVGRKVREVTYSDGKDKFIAPDLTALAEHITVGGISAMAFQENPDPILWCVLANGTLLSMTYEREQNVIAWARHPFITGGGTTGQAIYPVPSYPMVQDVPQYRYPTLQELTAAEIPDTPTIPADIALVSATSVTDAAGLQAMAAGNHYSIDADIDLTGVAWTPLVFDSTSQTVIEGNNHIISNLTINAPDGTYQGLFGQIKNTGGGEIRNLVFQNCSVTAEDSVAIFCGYLEAVSFRFKNIYMINCTVSQSDTAVSSNCTYAGTLFGAIYGYGQQISGCKAINCTINSEDRTCSYIGGLVGSIQEQSPATTTNFINCHVQGGTMNLVCSRPFHCGGFIGEAFDVVGSTNRNHGFYDCSSSMDIVYVAPAGDLSFNVEAIGGFIGYEVNTVAVSCFATGNLTFTSNGSWTSADEYQGIGGYIGSSSCYETLTNCYCTGTITFENGGDTPKADAIGGFVGFCDYDFESLRCYSTSDIIFNTALAEVNSVGGFIGQERSGNGKDVSEIKRSWSEGDITFNGAITAGTTMNSSPTAKGCIGGFVGFMDMDLASTVGFHIENSYTWTSIVMNSTYPADLTVSGFSAGWDEDIADVTFTNCYCAQTDVATEGGSGYTAQIPADGDSHGFGGGGATSHVVVTASFYDQQTSSLSTSDIATAHETSWLQLKSNFTDDDWDFDTIWYGLDPTTEYTVTDDLSLAYSSTGLGPNSVAAIPSSTEDEVWLVVARVINGSIVRYLEQVQPRRVTDREDHWFVDSGLDYDGDAETTFSGLDHLEGETVKILADGAVAPSQVVTNGSITITDAASRVVVGLPFRYILKPMRFDLSSGMDTTHGSLKRFAEVVISFYQTLNAKYGVDTDNLFEIDWRTEEAYGSPPALHTGDKIVSHEGGFDPEDSIVISGNDPLPCTVRAIIARLEVTGR